MLADAEVVQADPVSVDDRIEEILDGLGCRPRRAIAIEWGVAEAVCTDFHWPIPDLFLGADAIACCLKELCHLTSLVGALENL